MDNFYLAPQEAALIVIDVQNDFCHEEGACARMGRDVSAVQSIVPNIQTLIGKCKELHIPVIYVQNTVDQFTSSETWEKRPWPKSPVGPLDICKRGSWGADFYRISPNKNDIIIEKHRFSAFIATNLDMVLRNLKRSSLILTGVATNVCVESTARDAFMMDYRVTLVKDACANYYPELHEATCKNIELTFGLALNTTEILTHWNSPLHSL